MASKSLGIFGKELNEMTFRDVEEYFQVPHDESDIVEYKSFGQRANLKDSFRAIFRTICGMLNANGGIIIWGAPSGQTDDLTQKKTFTGALEPLSAVIENDRFINMVSDSIKPMPSNVNFKPLESGGQYVYLIEVQESDYKPHQWDNTYWMRLDGQTKPAPHYLVEALVKQIKVPKIEGYVKFENVTMSRENGDLEVSISAYIFNFSPLQNEQDLTLSVTTSLGTFKHTDPTVVKEAKNLVFGVPVLFKESIVIPGELAEKNLPLNLTLTFYGKLSPFKYCFYSIDLSRISLNKEIDVTANGHTFEENVIPVENQEELGFTREQTLLKALGRSPK